MRILDQAHDLLADAELYGHEPLYWMVRCPKAFGRAIEAETRSGPYDFADEGTVFFGIEVRRSRRPNAPDLELASSW